MRSCEACDSADVYVLRDGLIHEYSAEGVKKVWTYQLLQCRACGMGFVDPAPSLELANTFYPEQYGNYQDPGSDDGPIGPAKRRVATLRMGNLCDPGLQAAAGAGLGMIVEGLTGKTVSAALGVPLQLPYDATLFDLGCGSGAWLRSMRRFGYKNLYGYDIDANRENIRRLGADGINVRTGDFLQDKYEEKFYDCIRLNHVFEHLLEPAKVLKKCLTMLKPGGFIAMTHPCFNSWIVEWGLDYSPSLMLPKHLYHHTQKSTRLMLESAGFEVGEVKAFGVAAQFAAMINNKRKARGRNEIPRTIFTALSPIYNLADVLTGRGDFISAWARAPR